MGSSSVVSSVQFVCVGAKGQVSGRRASCCFLALGGVLCALLLTGGPLACLCPCWPASKGARLAIFLAYFAPSRCLFTHTKKFPSSGRQPAVALSPGRPIGRPSSPLERTRYTCPSHTHSHRDCLAALFQVSSGHPIGRLQKRLSQPDRFLREESQRVTLGPFGREQVLAGKCLTMPRVAPFPLSPLCHYDKSSRPALVGGRDGCAFCCCLFSLSV